MTPEWRQIVAEQASTRIERLHQELNEQFRLAVEPDDPLLRRIPDLLRVGCFTPFGRDSCSG